LLNARFKELGRSKYQVKVDGKTDAKFTTAVKRFQILANRKGAKLKVTGKVDDATYARLLKTFRAPTQKLRVTGEGAGLVARSEGLRLCPYRDAVGVPTQGYGHTSGVKMGAKCWTQKKALQVLTSDLDLFGKGVTRIVTVTIGSRQYNALVSWSFNVGLGAARGSTLMRELNRKHYAIAGNQFKVWNKAGGHVLPGLTIRRRAECGLYSKGSGASTRRKIRC
jgi:lysozyme